MGQTASAPAARPELFDVSVVEGGRENPRSLHFVDPSGQPVWAPGDVTYVSDLASFDAAQRVCRQIMLGTEFVPGTRVQFFKGGRRIKHSTVLKPSES
jgi:hypothetical protein